MVELSLKAVGLSIILSVFAINTHAQSTETTVDKMKIKTALSFSAGFLREDTKTIQLHGYIGMRPKEGRIELRGDGFYFINSFGERPRFTINHQLYAGAFYRFSDTQFQPYVGMQPGIAYSQSSEYGRLDEATNTIIYKKSVNPVGSITGGLDFFAEKLFFMFLETRYIFGKHKSDTYPVFLDEWRFSFGLGLHF